MTEQDEQEMIETATDVVNQVYHTRECQLKQYIHEQCLISNSLAKSYSDVLVSDIDSEVTLIDFKVQVLGVVAIVQTLVILWILGR